MSNIPKQFTAEDLIALSQEEDQRARDAMLLRMLDRSSAYSNFQLLKAEQRRLWRGVAWGLGITGAVALGVMLFSWWITHLSGGLQ